MNVGIALALHIWTKKHDVDITLSTNDWKLRFNRYKHGWSLTVGPVYINFTKSSYLYAIVEEKSDAL